MKLSVVVATYRRRASLQTLLGLLGKARLSGELGEGSEVIIVEQAPFEFSEEEARQAKRGNPRLRWLRTEQHGLPAARNIGVLASRGEIVLFLDDDAEPGPGYFSAYLDFFSRAGAKVAAASGPVKEPGGARAAGLSARLPFFISPFTGAVCGGADPGAEREVRTLRGGNMAFRRAALLEIGGFDITLEKVALREETDAGQRLKRLGYSIFFVPGAPVLHRRAASGGERLEGTELLYWGRRSESIFVTRNFPAFTWAGFYLRGLAAALFRAEGVKDLPRFLKAAHAGMTEGRRAALSSPDRGFLAMTAGAARWTEL